VYVKGAYIGMSSPYNTAKSANSLQFIAKYTDFLAYRCLFAAMCAVFTTNYSYIATNSTYIADFSLLFGVKYKL
jgi:hypothetical protein